MKRMSLLVCAFASLSFIARAQAPSDSELTARLAANRAKYAELDHGTDLRAQANAENRDVERHRIVAETVAQCPNCPKPDPSSDPDVQRAADASDLVAIGHVVRNIATLTANRSFVFTDSEFVVDEIWKNDSSVPVTVGSELTITSAGGRVRLDGHFITASVSNRQPVKTGHRYLFFLKYLPASRSYEFAGLEGFDLSGAVVVPLKVIVPASESSLLSNPTAFLTAMHSSVLSAPGGK